MLHGKLINIIKLREIMAKDGTNRGGARPGVVVKKKPILD
jgi:hypothetical protein